MSGLLGNTNIGGSSVKIVKGSFTTNGNGAATVSDVCFKPDLIMIDGFTYSSGGTTYRYCCGYDWTLKSSTGTNGYSAAFSDTYDAYGIEVRFTRNAAGFSVSIKGYSGGGSSAISGQKFSYVAMKYAK